MSIGPAWLKTAESSLDAARSIADAHPRSSASRAYYAAFAAAHAILIQAGESPRTAEGTWTHKDLPTALRSLLIRGNARTVAASLFKNHLEQCRVFRESADYAPLRTIDTATAIEACRRAGQLVFAARGAYAS